MDTSQAGGAMQTIERIKVIRDSTPNEYMVILKFKSHVSIVKWILLQPLIPICARLVSILLRNDTVVFYEEFNGTQFNSLEPNQCRLLFVDRIECVSYVVYRMTSFFSSHFTFFSTS